MKVIFIIERFNNYVSSLMSKIKVIYINAIAKAKKRIQNTPRPTIKGGKTNQINIEVDAQKYTVRRKLFGEKIIRDWLIVIATVTMAIYTYQLFEIATKQTNSSNKGVEIASKALRYQRERDSVNSILQSKKDSSFVISQAKRDSLNHESFILENRAYVIFSSFKTALFNFRGGETKIPILVKNVGKTPAQHVTLQTAVWLNEDSIGYNIKGIEKYLNERKYEGFTLGVNDSIVITSHFSAKLTEKDSLYFIIKKPIFYIFGVIEYVDIFKFHRLTYFCYEVDHNFIKGNNYEGRAYKKYNEIK